MEAQAIEIPGGVVQLRAATPEDVPLIRELAGRSWHAFYPGMISMPQIYFMLRQMYAPKRLLTEIQGGSGYLIACENTIPGGFLAYDPPRPGQPLMLQKFYLTPVFQGRGIGAAILRWLGAHALALGHDAIRLRVNKHNHRALKVYRRAGYRPIDALIEPIGEGHVMDDYVLERRLGLE